MFYSFFVFLSKKDEKAVKPAVYPNLRIRNLNIQGVLQLFPIFYHIFVFEDNRFEYTGYFRRKYDYNELLAIAGCSEQLVIASYWL